MTDTRDGARAAGIDLDAQDLRLMRAVADSGSITRAAAALGYSQPAVSQHIKRLEARTGVPLVERIGRRARLTEAGRLLARHAPAVVNALEAAQEDLRLLRGGGSGRVRMAGFPSASATVLPRLMAELARERPGIELQYVEAEPPQAVEAVREGRADLALTFSFPGDREDPHGESARGLTVSVVGQDDVLLVLPEGHPAAEGDSGIADLADENWIGGCPRCRRHLLELCARAGFAPRITFETDNFVAVEGLVAQGIGVATLPRMALQATPRHDGVAIRALPGSERRTLHLVAARGAERVPSVRAVLGVLDRVLPDILRPVPAGPRN
ncbi:LysR family transcriptional regulator [Microbacterium sp. JZ31]|uniref:LysR family transcriptional regulator n=1 Tax=Microbacterium sp. JZ31 TaxID=1906274 RepID=UPI001932308E|nr:LysR family transcriptional regulator [Microbacterium sp. JZ31]